MVRQHVTRPQHGEQVRDLGADSSQTRLRGRRPRLLFQVRPVELPQRAQGAEVEQPVRLIAIGGLQLELASEQLQHLWRHPGVDLQAHDSRVPAAAAKLRLDGGEQVLCVAVGVVEVAVARDPEWMVRNHVHGGEERLQVERYDVLERDKSGVVSKRDEARQHRRHLDAGEAMLATLWIPDRNRKVEREVGDVRKRMAWVYGQWRQHWEDLLSEDGVELRQLLLAHLVAANDGDARGAEGRDDARVVEPVLPLDESFDPAADGLQLLQRRHAVRRRHRDGRQHLLLEAGDADLEEVVQVLAEDGEEPHPLEQGRIGVLGHGQDALVEVQPGQLPIQESRGLREGCRAYRLRV